MDTRTRASYNTESHLRTSYDACFDLGEHVPFNPNPAVTQSSPARPARFFYNYANTYLPVFSSRDPRLADYRSLPISQGSYSSPLRKSGEVSSTPTQGVRVNDELASSPSPLTKYLSPAYDGISPPMAGSRTPFERHFTSFASNFGNPWTSPVDCSPVDRGSRATVSSSPGCLSTTASPESPNPADSSEPTPSPQSSQTLFSSPLTEVSSLTQLSSPHHSDKLPSSSRRSRAARKSYLEEGHSDDNSSDSSFKLTPPHHQKRRRDDSADSLKYSSSRRQGKRRRVSGPADKNHTRMSQRGRPSATKSSHTCSSPPVIQQRSFGSTIPVKPEYSLFYRRFPVSPYYKCEGDDTFVLKTRLKSFGGATYNHPKGVLDLYTPRFVKGIGASKVGLCPICCEPHHRGGDGQDVWLSTKFSAFKWSVVGSVPMSQWLIVNQILNFMESLSYHMQYAHGISATSARPFSPPTDFRTVKRSEASKREKTYIEEGKCHKCKKWVPIEGVKDVEVKVKELFWWKHAAACHQGQHIEGDDDYLIKDDIFHGLKHLAES
ncbi:hypothetical protein CONPUDRAFT_75615 [Coniophora puteana RWD-64-598 SS2]|uniref:Transcription regulator Rua1 C-terminal domain-containing protein n=1 Tax=Coniophora puteana (strain RWD-64-598) TaxID=741705 RepID=A0A5M3MEY2_CONPW|nr:uncharacterized protein CONPUDRAFT_75615 [Coniophora puteana RWD-64-598 SS2]EIW77829.1 hypothetical protein CONPUDRAFT_75615 [Coniophora puteana RWD-64-598 SS2]